MLPKLALAITKSKRILLQPKRRWLFFPLGLPGLLVVLAASPWLTIRVGRLRTERIGHFVMNTWLTVLDENLQQAPRKRSLDIWFAVPPISNSQILRMWCTKLRVWNYWIVEPVYLWLMALKLRNFLLEPPYEDRDVHDRIHFSRRPLVFTQEEELEGLSVVRALTGDESGAKWVCLHNRDSQYLSTQTRNQDWSYHDYRDTPISDYIECAETLADLGYWVFRMGKVTQEPLVSSHPRVVDYANSDLRSDFADVYLAGHCCFFLSSSSGVDALATIFKRPQIWVNLPNPFHPLIYKEDFIFTYKHFFDLETHRPLGLVDLQRRGAANFFRANQFEAAGIGLQNQTPEEITRVALQMHEELSDPRVKIRNERDPKQMAFWDVFPRIPAVHGSAPFRARIGNEFLASQPHLLVGPAHA